MRKMISALALAIFSTSCMAGNVLNLQTPAVVSQQTHIPDSIKAKCKVPELVGDRILESVSKVYGETRQVAGVNTADGLLLKTTITSV